MPNNAERLCTGLPRKGGDTACSQITLGNLTAIATNSHPTINVRSYSSKKFTTTDLVNGKAETAIQGPQQSTKHWCNPNIKMQFSGNKFLQTHL